MTKSDGPVEQAWSALRRRKLVFLAALVCVPLAAFLVAHSKEKQYTATATLLFESNEENAEATREAATNEALASLPVIGVKAAKQLKGKASVEEILGSIKVGSANEMANLTTISATTPDPELSAEIANAYSAAYVDFRREAAQKGVGSALLLAEKRFNDLPPDESSGPKGEALREQIDRLEIEQALRTGKNSIVQPASVPTSPSLPKVKRDVIIGILIGALLGLALVALLERVDRRVRSVEELESLFGLPILAKIPKANGFAGATLSQMLSMPEAEAFRALRTNLRYFNVESKTHSILIASPEPSDGKSTVALGLAGAMAEMGDDVVLVEADLRKHSSLGNGAGPPREGLSTVLAGTPLERALVQIPIGQGGVLGHRTLTALPSGPIPPNPPELLESDAMKALMAELARFDIVVIDSPALGYVSDALSLVPQATEIVAVGGLGKSNRDDVAEFNRHLSLTGNRPIGLVATMTDFDRSQYSYYMRSRS